MTLSLSKRCSSFHGRLSRSTAFTIPVVALILTNLLFAQEAPLAWNEVQLFRYNILQVIPANPNPDGTRPITVVFSVTNPKAGNAEYDILPATPSEPFKTPASLRVILAWNTSTTGATEFLNTKDAVLPVPRTIVGGIVTGVAPAPALSVNALSAAAKRCSDTGAPSSCFSPSNSRKFWIKATLPATATGSARIGIEGHPSITIQVAGLPVVASVPVKSVFTDVALLPNPKSPRRQVVDFAKCTACHDDRQHGNTVVPRLSLHGANRNEEPGVCVMCHNPNQTDAAYRTSGAEESVDFKRMVHGIHAGGMRKKPLIIIGRNGAVNDFSHVRFPSELRNCVKCHIDTNGKGTFELPLATTLGSTIKTQSLLDPNGGQIDIDPANDLRISPIAATCSACHDDSETKSHMIRMGASFGVVQSVLAGKEQCATCHGPGRAKDVRKEHEIRSSSGSTSRKD